MKQFTLFLFVLSHLSFAEAKDQRFKVFKENSDERAMITNFRPLSIYYENIGWNENATQIESGYLYLRNKNSGEIKELNLTETKPNSGVFVIDFPVGTLKEKTMAAEIYSPPQSMLRSQNRVSFVRALIEDSSIRRRPFLLRVIANKGQLIDVFDEKEQAIQAYNEYRKKMGLSNDALESDSIIQVTTEEKLHKKQPIDTSTLQSLFMANEKDLSSSNRKNQELREVLKAVEEKRRNAVLDEAKNWTPSQVSYKKKKATAAIKTAVASIKEQKFDISFEQFLQASDLNPTSEDLYQQYGVSLFRGKKLNQSIVVLQLSKPSEDRTPEKHFYLGMNFYQLKDYENAVAEFDKVLTLPKNKSFAATSAFYKGSALIEIQEYEKAKAAFQFVLDNSDDPKMDERAEKFIEYSMDRQALEKKRSNWFFASGVLGLMYDSNIVLARDQAREQGLVTGAEGWRLLTQVSTQARPYYSDSDELRVGFDLTALKSFDNSFGSNPTAEQADPYLIGLNVPWTHRGTLGGKGYFFDLTPGFEAIVMDLDNTGNEVINQSAKLDFNNTLVANKNWIAKWDVFLSVNDSDILGDTESADSFTAGLRFSSIIILNKDLERYLIPDISYRTNDAEGADFAFNRVDLGITYTSSVFGNWMWNSLLSYFLANYQSLRVDTNYSVSSGVSRRINRNWNWGLMASYIVNNSNINAYNKYNVVSTFSFTY